MYENTNFFLTRDFEKSFEAEGRVHNKQDSIRIEGEQKEFLSKLGYGWHDVELGDASPWSILDKIELIYPGSVPRRGPQLPKSYEDPEAAAPRKGPRR